jgi:6,7-dimethyl-8-ribityllumazine synthase
MKVHQGKLDATGLRFAIVASRFNEEITEKLLEGAISCLGRHGAEGQSVEVFRVPGAFEIPMTVARIANTRRFDAIVTIGALIRGETPHFDQIAAQVTQGISEVGVMGEMPVSFGVITCNTTEQAVARSSGGANKGWEAALAAIEMATLWREIKTVEGTERERSAE